MYRKTAIITGGAGFIGSHLCDLLLGMDFRVVCVDNLLTGSYENIRHIENIPAFDFIEHDVINPFSFKDKADFVFHFASPASPKDYYAYPVKTLEVGAKGTQNMLELAREKNACFVLASTSEVYGDPLKHPQKENYWGNVNPVGPRSVYDEAKRYAEAITMAYKRVYKIDTKIWRIFNTYGPRMRINDGRAIPNFIYQALKSIDITVYGDGTQTRSFCYIDDLIRGLSLLIPVEYPLPINIGNPEEYTIVELARIIIKYTGSKSNIVFDALPEDDPKLRRPDISLITELTGWLPVVKIDDGLRRTIEYFRGRI